VTSSRITVPMATRLLVSVVVTLAVGVLVVPEPVPDAPMGSVVSASATSQAEQV